MFIFALLGYALGNCHIMGQLDENHKDVANEIRENTRVWWNSILDSFKALTKDQKIGELKKQIEEIENE